MGSNVFGVAKKSNLDQTSSTNHGSTFKLQVKKDFTSIKSDDFDPLDPYLQQSNSLQNTTGAARIDSIRAPQIYHTASESNEVTVDQLTR